MLNSFQKDLADALKAANPQTCLDLLAQYEEENVNFQFAVFVEKVAFGARNRIVSPLHLACEKPELLPIAQLLIARGANFEAKDDKQRTPLICAAIARNGAAVSLLLGHRANIQAADDGGYFALDYAACPRDDVIASMLEQKSFPTLFSILAKNVATHQLDAGLLPQGIQAELAEELVEQKDQAASATISEIAFQQNLESVRKRLKDIL